MEKMKEYFEKSLIIAVLGIFVLIALAVPATAAEGINITEQWNMTFGGAGDDYGYSVQQTADGGYILAGDTRSYGAGDADVWLIKTDSKGNEQWSRTFGGAEADLLDRGSVRQTSDGGYVITGYTYSYGAGDADVWLIKTDMNGIEQWNRTFGGEGLDWGHSVRQTSDGGYVIAGRIIPPSAGARADAWLIKTDSNGVEQWNRTFGAGGCEYAASVQQTADDGYVMTGRTTSFGAAEADAWLIRTDSNGIEQWNRTFGGANYDYGYSVQQTSDGGYVIAGSTNGRQDVWLIKTDSNGTEEWNTIFGGPAKADEGYSVQQTSDGGYIIAGYTESYGTAGSADVWLIRTDSNGIEQWNMTVGGTGLEKGYSVHQTSDEGYIVTGFTSSYGAGGYDLWLIKLSTPIVRQIDLLPTALETPPTLYANLSNTISATIKNNGTGDAPSFNVSLSADGSPVDKEVVSGLGAGESTAVSLSWTPSRTGDFELCVAADCDSNINESEETNNVWCENVTVRQFSPCWNDSFDDESRIADKHAVIVHDGDVEIDPDNATCMWCRDYSIVAGLKYEYCRCSRRPAIAFNVTGDGRWNAIYESLGYYRNGSQWVEDPSLVAGLDGCRRPAIAFNITGNGRWNIITSDCKGYYWDGSQWVNDPSIVAGLSFEEKRPNAAIAFNVTGDGRWCLFSGRAYDCYPRGWYWNGSQWIEDSSLVAGLPTKRYWSPAIAFNITGDGRWNLISGDMNSYWAKDFSGYYWNGSQWVEDSSLTNGLGSAGISQQRWSAPAIAFNVTGDESWNIISGALHNSEFDGYRLTFQGNIASQTIDLPPGYYWSVFHANDTLPQETNIIYKILDARNDTLMRVVPGQPLTDITDTPIRLFAELTTNSPSRTPVLHEWSVCWAEGLPASGVLKEKKKLTSDPNSSINPNAATDSEGNLHVVWSEDRGGWKLYYKKLAPNGMVLVSDKRICSGSGQKIAVDSSGNVHVVYRGIAYPYPSYYLKLDNDGNILVGPKQFTPYSPTAIAVDHSGNVHVLLGMTYIKLDNNGDELVNYTVDSVQSAPYGTWDCMDVPSGIVVDSEGNAYTAYSKGLGACGGSGCTGFTCRWPVCAKAYYAKIDGDGVHKQDLTGDLPLGSLYPSVCVDSRDNKHVIWSQHNGSGGVGFDCLQGGGFDFYYTKFDKTGNKVIDGKRLTYEDYPPESYWYNGCHLPGVAHPIIDTESGVIHMAWSRESEKEIYYMAFDTSGGKVMDKVILSPPSAETAARNPNMASVQDGSHLVWEEKREHDAGSEIYYARLVLPPNSVFLMPPPGRWTGMNVNATYAIGIMHTMPGSETFNLGLDNLDGADVAELNKSTITLDALVIGEIILNVTDAVLGDYRVKVRAESQTNPEINASAIITTSVIVAKPDLIISAIDAYHNNTGYSPYFNLSNEVDVEVKNIGTADASAFNVSLYADGEFVERQNVSGLELGSSTLVQFKWTPVGADCFKDCTFTDTSRDYYLTVVADCDNDVNESEETNNNLTKVEKACYNGYMADEPLENVAHGLLHGGLLFTTGDGTYGGLYSPGDSIDTTYEITLPAGASVVLARLNVYYTWHYEKDSCPAMEVSITNATGTYVVPLDRDYNDIKCQRPGAAWVFPWGNYVYNLTDHIQGNGTYTVTVKRTGGPSFCIAAPGIEVLYKDETKPLIGYWINEGADVLIGGRRGDGGYLSLAECINNATFPGNVELSRVKNATLGVVSPWAGAGWTPGMTNYLYFNDIVLGRGVYQGYSEIYSEAIGGISMEIGGTNAQVGVNLSDVTDYLQASDNRVGQGDDGDNMMPCNAFLVVEYEPPTPFMIYGWVNYSTGEPVLNPNVTITNLNTAEVFIAETNASSNYYQVVTSSEYVSAGNVLRFYASDNGNKTEFNHMVMQEEIDAGVLKQNITIVPDTTPPASITNLHNTTYEQSYIIWSWTNPADADFNYTVVYIAGNWEGNTSEPFYNATGFSPDTAYEIGTRTVDKTGNINMMWVNHSARTAPTVPLGVCGDVTGDESVDVGDVILLGNHVRYPAKYPVDEWAADVNCDSSIDVGDVILLGNHVRYPAKYSLGCCV